MTDIARLGITVDSATVPQATQQLDRLGDQAAVTGRQVAQGTGSANRGFSSLAASMRGVTGSHGFRQVSMQLSQVAQQSTATGQPLQALAIQAADIGMVFGPMGIAAGVAAGALLPLAGNLLGATNSADELEAALQSLDRSMGALREPMKILEMSAGDLIEKYGAVAQRVREFAAVEAELRVSEAREALREQVALMEQQSQAYFTAQNAGQDYRNVLSRIFREFGLVGSAAREFETLIERAATAPTFDQQQAALAKIVDFLQMAGIDASQLPREFAEALASMIQLSNRTDEAAALMEKARKGAEGLGIGVGGAADEAARLARNLSASVLAQADFDRRNQQIGGGRGADPRDFMREGAGEFVPGADVVREADVLLGLRNRPGSGGGTSDAQRLHNERLREAERIIERTRTETERYARELEDLNELHQMGYLDAEQYARGVDLIEAELNSVQFDSLRQGIDSLSDAMAQAIVNGESMGDAIANAFKQMAAEYIANDIRSILGGLFGLGGSTAIGGQGGGFFSAIFGGFRATGGPVSSGVPYVVGEQGPELFVPGASGQIVSNENSRAALSGGGGMTINVSQTFTGGVTQADLARLLPVMEERTKQAVVESVQRGGAMARAFR